ncbi:SIMPL domain-containing protein [Mannheimia sp. AT1]|uniref:SIMPL domain-containing protein n=1 Tax=Mannheimia cairinae TaxID=3025936 RepID=A0ABT5MPF7_9PAST|nr:SIMPL domain-containing protein [Mannheimia cairinae]MDD0824056.1 SIMPL domain-containing protein [Mannheimia cairinae]MDD0827172.1 SIMPL domain-containing protein [Mannheimia cairinae]
MSSVTKYRYLAVLGGILAVGLMAAAFILGNQFKNLQQTGVITVKGLAEAEHKATLGAWRVSVFGWGPTYNEAMKANQLNLNQAVKFLKEQGFTDTDREITDISVNERTEYYVDEFGKDRSRKNGYNATRSIVLSTKDLPKLQKALAQIQFLRAENEAIDFSNPDYYLENLEEIKRDLIAKATQDAYVRAEEFAKTSNVKVGLLRSASQGSFDIKSTRPNTEDSDDSYGGSYDTSTIDKKVRLVVTIQYAIN